MATTIKCPYCDEDIAATAKKCKHCGEWVEEYEPRGFVGRTVISLILSGIGWALFYFGSWHLVLGKKISIMLQFLSSGKLKQQGIIFEHDGFVFRINEKYYGFVKDAHFFDSPVIQWIMLFVALSAFYYAIHNLIFGNWGDDD